MSASVPPQTPAGQAPGTQPGAADPSMEDILASIRRILSEDEQQAKPAEKPDAKPEDKRAAAPAEPVEDDVLALDDSMLVAEPDSGAPDAAAALIAAISAPEAPLEFALADPPAPEPAAEPAPVAPPVIAIAAPAPPYPDRLINPEAEAATAGSVSTLLRTLESGRQAASMAVYRGGPTLEDMVREELRALLKTWLDANLPPLVERLVRAEIERVVSRAVG